MELTQNPPSLAQIATDSTNETITPETVEQSLYDLAISLGVNMKGITPEMLNAELVANGVKAEIAKKQAERANAEKADRLAVVEAAKTAVIAALQEHIPALLNVGIADGGFFGNFNFTVNKADGTLKLTAGVSSAPRVSGAGNNTVKAATEGTAETITKTTYVHNLNVNGADFSNMSKAAAALGIEVGAASAAAKIRTALGFKEAVDFAVDMDYKGKKVTGKMYVPKA